MHQIRKSKHYSIRTQQRCINRVIELLLIGYGESKKCSGGVESIFFSRESLIEIRNDIGVQACRMCERHKNAYLICSEDGVLITAARSYRRTIH